MKSLPLAALALLLSILSAPAVALLAEQIETAAGENLELGLDVEDCAFAEPPVVPDGKTAAQSDLAAAGAAIRVYQADMQASFACIEEVIESLGEDMTPEQDSALTAFYNNGVEQLEMIAASFNEQLRLFRARQAEQSE